jgi:hypothetical protein
MTMTDRKNALIELRAEVKAGDIPVTGIDRFRAIPKRGGGAYGDPNWYDAAGAYWRGDLDAAKSLHEAVLPNHRARIDVGKKYRSWIITPDNKKFDAYSDTPARAWLIAILTALIEEEPHAQLNNTEV